VTAPDGPKRVRPRATHTCPCGCGRRISRRRWYCPETWHLVPDDLRAAAYAADRAALAASEAIRMWLDEHPDQRAGAQSDGAIDQAGTDTDGAIGAGTP
jgi:hypothetical protein